MSKGRANLGEMDEILENFQTSPSFLENYDAIFFIMDMAAYMQGGMRAR